LRRTRVRVVPGIRAPATPNSKYSCISVAAAGFSQVVAREKLAPHPQLPRTELHFHITTVLLLVEPPQATFHPFLCSHHLLATGSGDLTQSISASTQTYCGPCQKSFMVVLDICDPLRLHLTAQGSRFPRRAPSLLPSADAQANYPDVRRGQCLAGISLSRIPSISSTYYCTRQCVGY
jgi:hypothetical protein